MKTIKSFLLTLIFLSFVNLVFAQQIEYNSKSNSIHRIYEMKLDLTKYNVKDRNVDSTTVMQITQDIFKEYGDKIRIEPDNFKFKKFKNNFGLYAIDYTQFYNGIEVYGSELGYTLTKDGNIIVFGGEIYPDIKISTTPKLSEKDALLIAADKFSKKQKTLRIPAKLVIFPLEENSKYSYYLSWMINYETGNLEKDVIYFVDAINGKVISEINNIHNGIDIQGTVRGYYWPKTCNDAPVLTTYQTNNIQIYSIYGQLVTTSNSDDYGYYHMTANVAYGYYYLSIPAFENQWVKLFNNSSNTDSKGDPIYHMYTFSSYPPSVHDVTWEDNASNVRYHVPRIHDYFKSLFSYSGWDNQMSATVDYGSNVDGMSNGNRIGFGTRWGRPFALSSDAIFHEYSHNVLYQIYGNWIGGGSVMGNSMDEGLSDYYAGSFNNDEAIAEDVLPSEYIRHLSNNYSFDGTKDSHWNGQVIGGACWDTRQSIGSYIADRLVYIALVAFSPKAHNHHDFGKLLLFSDVFYVYFFGGNSHETVIRTAFANHGINLDDVILQKINNTNNENPENAKGIKESDENNPKNYCLNQNYPNPFNPSTFISYSIPEETFVKLTVYNNLGQIINVLLDKNQNPGNYKIEWNPKNLPSGIYYYKLETKNFNKMNKMLFTK